MVASLVTELDTIYSSFTNGAKLAIDPQNTVHTGLMIADRQTTIWNIYYAKSNDAGLSWSEREPVSLLPLVQQWDPSIAVDVSGNAYLAWQDMRETKAEIWFSTNALTGLAETRSMPDASRLTLKANPSICHGSTTLHVSAHSSLLSSPSSISIFDPAGRLIRHSSLEINNSSLPLDLTNFPSGIYLVRVKAGKQTAQTKLLVLGN